MGKEYVPVVLYVNNGVITPKLFKSGMYDEWVKILEVTDSRRRASLVAGSVGIRYKCIITHNETKREIYLFDEGNSKWFIENDDIPDGQADKKSKECRYCYQEIKEPIFDRHQGRYSIICPYCRSRLVEWKKTMDEAIASWNGYMCDDC